MHSITGELADALALFATLPNVVITPNTVELGALLGRTVEDIATMRSSAIELAERTGMHVLAKGGHINAAPGTQGDAVVVDVLVEHSGSVHNFAASRLMLPAGGIHGTGCALASALATYLGHGEPLAPAAQRAQAWVHQHIATSVLPGTGAAAVV